MKTKVYIIAEIGKASNGDINDCKKLITECKNVGANAVRFHHFSLEESVYPEALLNDSERAWSFKLQLPFLQEKLFSFEEYCDILSFCKALEIDFIATPWDFTSFELFEEIGVDQYKIHSMNIMNVPLVSKVLQTKKRTFLSTGGLSEKQVKQLCFELNLSQCNAALLHSVSVYPAPANIMNLGAIEILKKYHPVVGYSSNDLLQTSAVAACTLGATIFEKHVHIDEVSQERHKASVSLQQFSKIVQEIREVETLLSRKIKQESRGEMVNQDILSKSLVLQEDLAEGSILCEENLTMQLPSKGVSAKEWFSMLGKKTAHNVKKGNYLYSTDILQPKETLQSVLEKKEKSYLPGKKGVVVRLKDLDEMIADHRVDYVEVHYAASDLKQEDVCKEYDLDLVVHLPEYADGKLLDLSSHDEELRQFSVEVINKVMQKARKLQPYFKKSQGKLKFIVHPGTLTYRIPDPNPMEQYALFLDSLQKLDSSGLEVLIENMTPFAWFLDNDWSPIQGMSNSFMDAEALASFCRVNNYYLCLDVCHAKLFCNYVEKDLFSYMKTVRPFVKHIHFSDCTGIDGEGLQVGDGEINWQEICEVFENYEYGWTPEIWNGHHDHGKKFYQAHERLNLEFKKFRNSKIFEKEIVNFAVK